MEYRQFKIAIFIIYFTYGILLNSVGTAILASIKFYHVTPYHASVLEPYKDLSITLFSFILTSTLRFKYIKTSLTIALTLLIITCCLTPVVNNFIVLKLMFAATGSTFALIKIVAYSSPKSVFESAKQHASFLSFLEGVFMLGVLSGYWIFSVFLDQKGLVWNEAFWVFALLLALGAVLLHTANFPQLRTHQVIGFKKNTKSMWLLVLQRAVMLFILCVFIYVFIEQAITTWLPTFFYHVLKLTSSISVQMASLLAVSAALGRFFASYLLKNYRWTPIICTFLFIALLLFVASLLYIKFFPHAHHQIDSWSDVPFVVYLLPMMGFFLAPTYPCICSSILYATPHEKQTSMATLIILFSALGGTTGSRITGFIFGHGGVLAMSFSIIPIVLLLALLTPLQKLIDRYAHKNSRPVI